MTDRLCAKGTRLCGYGRLLLLPAAKGTTTAATTQSQSCHGPARPGRGIASSSKDGRPRPRPAHLPRRPPAAHVVDRVHAAKQLPVAGGVVLHLLARAQVDLSGSGWGGQVEARPGRGSCAQSAVPRPERGGAPQGKYATLGGWLPCVHWVLRRRRGGWPSHTYTPAEGKPA